MQNNKTFLKRFLSAIICIMLITAIALSCTGCTDKFTKADASSPATSAEEKSEVTQLGEGETQFNFTATNAEGEEQAYLIKTDKKTVGDALLEHGLIAGEDSAYGLYVKTVCGITLDFDNDGMYWAFYIGGEYAMSGVDTTEVVDGESYAFKAEK